LHREFLRILVPVFHFLCDKVHLEYFVLFGEQEGIWFLAWLRIFEIESHANFVEPRVILNNDPLNLLILSILSLIILRLLLENEELVLFLLIHHQILATDDGKEVFTFRFLEPNDLIWFPGVRVQQLNRNFRALIKSLRIKHQDLVDLGYQERAHFL
jgi:hypothetical protein